MHERVSYAHCAPRKRKVESKSGSKYVKEDKKVEPNAKRLRVRLWSMGAIAEACFLGKIVIRLKRGCLTLSVPPLEAMMAASTTSKPGVQTASPSTPTPHPRRTHAAFSLSLSVFEPPPGGAADPRFFPTPPTPTKEHQNNSRSIFFL